MTPAARIAAAIGILDRVLEGDAAEQVLTGWGRANRFAGSKDRAAIRDHVYGALRCLRSFTALAGIGAPSGRALMIGAVRAAGADPDTVFDGAGYGPPRLSASERAALRAVDPVGLDPLVQLDCPDWIAPALQAALGAEFDPVMRAMQSRAPVFLRVNAQRIAREDVQARLRADGIATRLPDGVNNALQVTENERRIQGSDVYADGLVELQDLSPQTAVAELPLEPGMRVLDYCAGGGGKVLAMAARCECHFTAHDAIPARMRDLPVRAKRAGATVAVQDTADLEAGSFDLVLLDVPCSGTGTWRRDPDAKWKLTPARLEHLMRLQSEILERGSALVAPGGTLAYMTCSLLEAENQDRVCGFLRTRPEWRLASEQHWTPISGGDGFYSAHLTHD